MYINIGKELNDKIREIAVALTKDSTEVLDISFYIEGLRIIYRNDSTRQSFKVNVPYFLLKYDDINKIIEDLKPIRTFNRKYEKLHKSS